MTTIAAIPFDDVGFDATVDTIVAWALEGSGGYVCTPNVDHVVKAARDPAFRAAVLGARLRVPDGMGVVYGSRIRGTPLRATVTGRLLPDAVAARLSETDTAIALVGGPAGAADRAAAALRARGRIVAFAASPPMGFEIGAEADSRLVEAIQRTAARVVFVGFGAPKQERWMAHHAAALSDRVLVGVGQAIEVLAGDTPVAPRWMTRVGLEWAYRLARSPRRFARRYLLDDPRFFGWMLRDRLRRRA